MTPTATAHRYVLTADEVGAMIGQTGRGIRKAVQERGHVLDVKPVPDTGRRVLFSRAAIERALGLA